MASKVGDSGVRYEWYQTDAFVVLTVLLKHLKPKSVNVDICDTSVAFTSQFENSEDFNLNINFSNRVLPDQSSWKCFSSKVEIKLKKFDGGRWNTLERDERNVQSAKTTLGSSGCSMQNYPSSSVQKHDWDKIVEDIQKNEEEEEKTLSGEAAVSKLFEKIYSEGSEEVRRAMNKSFMESGGTVLSTNWKEVCKETVSVKPPEGMEFKKWEQ